MLQGFDELTHELCASTLAQLCEADRRAEVVTSGGIPSFVALLGGGGASGVGGASGTMAASWARALALMAGSSGVDGASSVVATLVMPWHFTSSGSFRPSCLPIWRRTASL